MAATTLSVLNNLQISTLIDWNDVSRVRKISKGCYFMQDIEELNVGLPMASRSIDVLEYRETYIGDDELTAEILSTAIVGGNLVIDLVPQNGNPVDFYRVGTVMFCKDKKIQGQVVSASAGQIVVAPYAGSTVATLNSSFVVGETVYEMGVSVAYRNSGHVNGINYFPDIQVNYLNTMREGADWNRVDKHKARIEWKGEYWESSNISRTLDRMLKAIERRWMWGLPSYDPANSEASNGGIDWCIRNRGGVVSSFAALPSQGQFQDWLTQLFYRKPGYNKLKKMYMGNKLYQHINANFTTGYITQIQPTSVQTGEINYNSRMYKVGGFEVELITGISLFQEGDYDATLTAGVSMTGMKKEWSCYCIDQEPVEIEGAGFVPAIEKLHFGDSPFYISKGTGIGDCPVGMPMVEGSLGDLSQYQVSTSAVDASTLDLMYNGGVNMPTGNYSGIFEASI